MPDIKTPMPGNPVKGSEIGRPIMAALNLLSQRWILRIIWELREGPRGFRDMRIQCDQLSPTTLSKRINELKEAGIVENNDDGALALTDLGQSLGPALNALATWSDDWADHIASRGAD